MWKLIYDIYEKHTFLNKLAARRRFYTAKMQENDKVLQLASHINQLAATLFVSSYCRARCSDGHCPQESFSGLHAAD